MNALTAQISFLIHVQIQKHAAVNQKTLIGQKSLPVSQKCTEISESYSFLSATISNCLSVQLSDSHSRHLGPFQGTIIQTT